MKYLPMLSLLVACSEPVDPGPAEPSVIDNFGKEEALGEAFCENLETTACMLPFPSNRYLDTSGETPKVAFEEEAMPGISSGGEMSPEHFSRADGFGAASPVMFQLPGATLTGTTLFDVEASLEDDHPTVLLDATTGERLAHWLETDHIASTAGETLLIMRPAQPFPRGHRIIAAVRGLVDEAGEPVSAADGFVPLRDGEVSELRGVHARRARFESEVFEPLVDAGVAREDLQLAWDFTIASDDNATRQMVALRDRMIDLIGDEGPEFEIVSVQEDVSPEIGRLVEMVAQVPSFLNDPDEEGVRTFRVDDDGLPVAEGFEEVTFRLQFPNSVLDADGPSPVMQYGHGFLGSINEANNGWLRDMAERHQFVILSADMQGMYSESFDIWLRVLYAGGSKFPLLAHEGMQGVGNHVALQRLMLTGMQATDDEALTFEDGSPIIEEDVWYYGNSQGGSVGTIVTANSLDVRHGVLGVPGSGYPFLLQRSTVFSVYANVLSGVYSDGLGVSMFLGLVGTGWDSFDPLTYAIHMGEDPLPNTPSKKVLLHVAKEDAQVHNEASFILGRATNSVLMVPAVRPVGLLPEQSYPFDGPASVVEVDFSVPDDTTPLDPPVDATDTHGSLRRWYPGQDQMVEFLRSGRVIDVCEGSPCVTDEL